jgi:predicted RNA-binding Zn ribbon-like protein
MADVAVPADAALVKDFVNTIERPGEKEDLISPSALEEWLRARSLLPAGARLGDEELERVRAVREAIREVVRARHHDEAPDEPAVAVLNEALSRVQMRPAFSVEGRAALAIEGPPVDVALASILEALRRGQESGEAERLKVCRSEACLWAYYDASKNRSRAWCDMAACGNRVKARAYRERKRQGG